LSDSLVPIGVVAEVACRLVPANVIVRIPCGRADGEEGRTEGAGTLAELEDRVLKPAHIVSPIAIDDLFMLKGSAQGSVEDEHTVAVRISSGPALSLRM